MSLDFLCPFQNWMGTNEHKSSAQQETRAKLKYSQIMVHLQCLNKDSEIRSLYHIPSKYTCFFRANWKVIPKYLFQ